jgi:hypothetical protein
MGRGKTHGKEKTYHLLLFHRSSLGIRKGRNHPRLLAAVGKGGRRKGGEGDVVQSGWSRCCTQE